MKVTFLNKAKENIKAAQLCFDAGLYNACANRMYYSSLQAAFVALESKEIGKGKIDHKWIQSDFADKLIKRQKIYPSKFKSYLSDMQLIRNKADYLQEEITHKIANRWLYRAKEMLECIEKEIAND